MKDNYLNLTSDVLFDIENDKKLGVMRIDWYDGRLANTWNPTDLLIKLNSENSIDLKKLQEELNTIQFDELDKFYKVEELCNGNGYDKERLLCCIGKHQRYVIKLVPVIDAYSYIYVYNK